MLKLKYKIVLSFVGLFLFLTACNYFESKEKKAIELVQKSKVESGNVLVNTTWLEEANSLSQKDINKKYSWTAKETSEKGIYLVEFIDEKDWGYRFEVNLQQNIVKYINDNEYLSRKYNLLRLEDNNEFNVSDIGINKLSFKKINGEFKIVYEISGVIINNTNNNLVEADVEGKLKLIFKDKTVSTEKEEKNYYENYLDILNAYLGKQIGNFKEKISNRYPWKSGETRKFSIITGGLDKIYLKYVPEYIVFDLSLKAKDPIGYEFDKDIKEVDLKDKWKEFIKNTDSLTLNSQNVKTHKTSIDKNNPKKAKSTQKKWITPSIPEEQQ